MDIKYILIKLLFSESILNKIKDCFDYTNLRPDTIVK